MKFSVGVGGMPDGASSKLTESERKGLEEWRALYYYVSGEDRKRLPSSFMNIWWGNSATALVRHPDFEAVLSRARAEKEAVAAKDRELMAKRRAKRYFDFWSYRGIVYGAQKRKERHGDRIYLVLEFFLQINGRADHQVKLYGYDLPIANGQEVAVIYGSPKSKNSGTIIFYTNFALQRHSVLTDEFKKLTKSRAYSGDDGISPEAELNEYRRTHNMLS